MNKRREAAIKSAHAFFGDGPASDLSPEIVDAMERLRALAKPRDTNLGSAPLAGRWMYRDRPEDEPVPMEVVIVHGATLVRFLDDEATEIHFRDLPDCENWRQHFRRIG